MSPGRRVAALRRARGLSQRELAAKLDRSESWLSQVERDIQPIDRLGILGRLAEALDTSVSELRPEVAKDDGGESDRRVNDLEALRLVLTGHPALPSIFDGGADATSSAEDPAGIADAAWSLAHASRFAELSELLARAIPALEVQARRSPPEEATQTRATLSRLYHATSAAFARQDEPDSAWLAGDRAIWNADMAGDQLGIIAAHFRIAHAFIRLGQLDQAAHVANAAIEALEPVTNVDGAPPESLSMSGAMHLVAAVVDAKTGDRSASRAHIAAASQLADRIGADRNDYQTEFGPTNVRLHAVATAVDLGDAGEALEVAANTDASALSAERQARLRLDVARAHGQRRNVGLATEALLGDC